MSIRDSILAEASKAAPENINLTDDQGNKELIVKEYDDESYNIVTKLREASKRYKAKCE